MYSTCMFFTYIPYMYTIHVFTMFYEFLQACQQQEGAKVLKYLKPKTILNVL